MILPPTEADRKRRTKAAALVHMHPSMLLPPKQDIRDRTVSDYREWFERLVADVMERHVQQPIIGYKDAEAGPEAVRVLDGWTRTLAARVAGLDAVPVLLHDQPPDDDELLESSLQANAMRLDMNDFEYAAVYAQIQQKRACTRAELAARLNVAPSTVSKRMRSLDGIPEDMRHLFGKGEGKLCGRGAYALGRLKDDESKRELAKIAIERNLRVEVLEEMVRTRLGKKEPKAKTVKIKLMGMTLIIAVPDPAKVKEFITRLGEALKTLEKLGSPISSLPDLMKV